MGAHDVRVRAATLAEAADVAWLAAMTFPLACPPSATRLGMAAHVAHKLTPTMFRGWAASVEHALLVAERRGELLGYALLRLGRPEGPDEAAVLRGAVGDGPYVELSKIYVHPDALGSPASSVLMVGTIAGARDLAEAHGHDHLPLWLGTNGENHRAQAFYRKHGFELAGTRRYQVGDEVHDDLVMLRRP